MARQFAVIGLGRFGYHVAQTLTQHRCEVMAIDNDEEKIQSVADLVTHAVQLDATDEKALRAIGVQDVDAAIVSIGENIEASILIVMTLKEMGVREIIAKAVTPIHGKILRNLGVSRVVFPEREVAIRLANGLVTPSILEYLDVSPDYSIVEIPAAERLVGKPLAEGRFQSQYGATVIAIRRKVPYITEAGESEFSEEMRISPSPEEVIEEGDIFVLLGPKKNLEQLQTP